MRLKRNVTCRSGVEGLGKLEAHRAWPIWYIRARARQLLSVCRPMSVHPSYVDHNIDTKRRVVYDAEPIPSSARPENVSDGRYIIPIISVRQVVSPLTEASHPCLQKVYTPKRAPCHAKSAKIENGLD